MDTFTIKQSLLIYLCTSGQLQELLVPEVVPEVPQHAASL